MTIRKVHFDFGATQTDAYCGAKPREGAAPLELSERRKDVTCTNCRAALAEYDLEAGAMFLEDDIAPLHTEIAGRHGLEPIAVYMAFEANVLKR